jgi:hypothetical protein
MDYGGGYRHKKGTHRIIRRRRKKSEELGEYSLLKK